MRDALPRGQRGREVREPRLPAAGVGAGRRRGSFRDLEAVREVVGRELLDFFRLATLHFSQNNAILF